MQDTSKRYRVYEGAGVPPLVHPGPRRKWGDIPLELVAIGDLIEMPMRKGETDGLINAIRSYVYRVSRRTNKTFTVRRTDFGVSIWRTK